MKVPFGAGTRKAILARYNAVQSEKEERELNALGGTSGGRFEDKEVGRLLDEIRDLTQRYLDGLPKVAISRCPFSGDTVVHSLDVFGIDGLWWDYETPLRPIESLPRTFHTLSGAIALASPVELASFVVRPGPGVPFVIPGLLGDPSVVAVISSVAVGLHTGYPVCYFSSNPESVDFLPNSWGASFRLEERGLPGRGWSSREVQVQEMDFDLEPWVRSEKLGWIAPGDPAVRIRTSVDDCPYLAIKGTQLPQTVFRGKVTYG